MAETTKPAGASGKLMHHLRLLAATGALVALAAGAFAWLGYRDRSVAHQRLTAALETVASERAGVIRVDPWLDDCGRACEGGYGDFVDRHHGEHRRLSRREIRRKLDLADGAPRARRLDLDRATLARRIRRALVIDDLLDGIDTRHLLVATLDERSVGGTTKTHLLFGDPEVGSFDGVLLQPSTSGMGSPGVTRKT